MNILLTTCGGVIKGIKSWTEYALSKELIRRGHDVTVLTSSTVKKVHSEAKNKEVIDGINVIRFNPILPSSLIYMLKNEWDVINAHFPGHTASISSYAILRKKIKNVPIVHNVMGLYHDPYLVEDVQDPLSKPINYNNMQKKFPLNPLRLKNWFSHLPILNSDIVGALTEWEKKELMKFGVPEEKLRIMPVGISVDNYKKKVKENFKEKYNIDGNMLLFLGQPIQRKGPEYLLKAAALLKDYPINVVFAGYKRNEQIENMSKALGIEDNVKFVGFLSEEDKISALKSADALVFPTLYEGFGVVILEAMAAGCPVVTTNVAGVPEIVNNSENGLLVEPKNHTQIAKAVVKLIEEKPLRNHIISNGKKNADKYDWKKLTDKYLDAYSLAIDGNAAFDWNTIVDRNAVNRNTKR